MTDLIPQFGGALWTLAAFLVALAVIVTVHEFGHYYIGRLSGIRAEVFSVGFGPRIAARRDRRGTVWQVAAIPLGGYVRFLGDANAASAGPGKAVDPALRRQTLTGAPLWARFATLLAGPVFNFILSILIFAGWFMIGGVATDQPIVGSLKPTPWDGQTIEPGDRILALNGTETPDWVTLVAAARALPPDAMAEYRVDRGGRTVTLPGPHPFPPVADAIAPRSAAMSAGMVAGDVVVAVGGQPIQTFDQLRTLAGGSEGQPLALTVWRDGRTLDVTLTPRRTDLPLPDGGFETRWVIGLSGGLVFAPETRSAGPVEAVGLAGERLWRILGTSLSALWHIASGQISTCNMQGAIGIAQTAGAAADAGLEDFILFIGLLSAAVGMLNLFPIPVLDGGHLVFHAWEAVAGRPPSDRALRVLMGVGLVLILSLMVFALGNDVFC